MATVTTDKPSALPTPIRTVLDELKGLIRRYVILQTLVAVSIVGLLSFWLAGLVDYFPVMMGAAESPRWARAAMLGALIGGILWLLYRVGLRKWWVRWQDSTLALLLERRFPQLNHALITTIQSKQGKATTPWPDVIVPRDPELLASIEREALASLNSVEPHQVMRWEPLRLQMGLLGGLLALSFIVTVWQPAWTWHWTKRLFALSDVAWPRACSIRVDGLEIDVPGFSGDDDAKRYLRPFVDSTVSMPRGHNAKLLVSADLLSQQVPELCMLSYRGTDGRQGRASLRRMNETSDQRLPFVLEGPPLEAIDQNLAMTIQAGDARIAGLRLEVIDAPQLLNLRLRVEYPRYLLRNPTSTWIDETLEYRTGLRIPQGSKVTLIGRANRSLDRTEAKITATNFEGDTTANYAAAKGNAEEFEMPIGQLTANSMIELRLWDTTGHCSTKIQTYYLGVLQDEVPSLDLKLNGIGSAITEAAILPIEARVADDHGVSTSWLELGIDDKAPWRRDIELSGQDKLTTEIDLKALGNSKVFEAKAGQSLNLNLQADDYFDLSDMSRTGRATPIQLSIVTAGQLLVILERRELAMRGRLELVLGELNQLRELIVKLRQTNRDLLEKPASSQSDSSETTTSAEANTMSPDKLQLPRAQQAVAQVEKSGGELQGVELEVKQIYQELINNRIDSQDRQERLENRVRVPLEALRLGSFNELQKRCKQVESGLEKGPVEDASVGAVLETLSESIASLESILQAMIDIQDFNEVVDMVRSMVDDQGKLIDRTKAEQKQRLLDQFKF